LRILEFTTQIDSKHRSLSILKDKEYYPKSCNVKIQLTTKQNIIDFNSNYHQLKVEMEQTVQSFRDQAKNIILRSLQNDIDCLNEIRLYEFINGFVQLSEGLTVYNSRLLNKQYNLVNENKTLAYFIVLNIMFDADLGNRIHSYLNTDRAKILAALNQHIEKYHPNLEKLPKINSDPNLQLDKQFCHHCSDEIARTVPELFFETHSTINRTTLLAQAKQQTEAFFLSIVNH
jgi:hypothetical protein